MRSEASTVKEYIDGLPEERRKAIKAVRAVVRKNLPQGFQEAMNWGMIAYQVPLRTYPNTYNGQPLMYAALASQRNHMAVYLSGIYSSEKLRKKFEAEYNATGRKPDVGKSCVRFKSIEDLPLPVVGKAIASLGVEEFIELYEKARGSRSRRA